MLKLKLQYFGHLMRRVDSLEKTLMLGGIGGRRRRGRPRMRWLDGITDSMDVSLSPGVGDGQGGLACCDSWGPKELDTTEQLNWAELIQIWKCIKISFNWMFHLSSSLLYLIEANRKKKTFCYILEIVTKFRWDIPLDFLMRQNSGREKRRENRKSERIVTSSKRRETNQ